MNTTAKQFTLIEWIGIWIKAARAPFLVTSAIPAVLGGVIAYANGSFDWVIFVLAFLGILSAHTAADFIDDYFDYKNRNFGNKDQQFHDSPLVRGIITAEQVLLAFWLSLGLALAAGVYILIRVGAPVLWLAAIGAFIVLFYTSPPIRLNFRGLGETALFLAFGPMIVFSVYFVLTQSFSWLPILAAVPVGIFVMNVGIVSNIFDHNDDIKNGKFTMPVKLGQARAVQVLAAVTILAYLFVVSGVALRVLPLGCLLTLLTAPMSYKMVALARNYTDLSQYQPAMSQAIGVSTLGGLAMVIGYAIEIIVTP
ncbi:MAG: prenyltransferase [Chloroherpetonaceae bacterium]|nr:prenyltransferase [Chloroherpetonaceae bacterium]MCS7212424.1 prenyltransferase [Chloroherpetonaceae bacterium]MDW8019321.1 prenyltransferase [Chloroherpetonaceae bacterium]